MAKGLIWKPDVIFDIVSRRKSKILKKLQNIYNFDSEAPKSEKLLVLKTWKHNVTKRVHRILSENRIEEK